MAHRAKTPSFWYARQPALHQKLSKAALLPLSWLYRLARRVHITAAKTKPLSLPSICVGNIVSGGSGKTPTALAILEIAKAAAIAESPAFLSRGYGGKAARPMRVDPQNDHADITGDEPLLLAKHAPVFLDADRHAASNLAKKAGHDLIILDDGFQNPTFRADINLVVIDGVRGFGNGKLIPAGPLREERKAGFDRADALCLIGEDETNITDMIPANLPVFKARLIPDLSNLDLRAPYIGFAGLGMPQKFQDTLNNAGLDLRAFYGFPDHHPYEEADLRPLLKEAREKGAKLITTEKDAIRLPTSLQADDRAMISVLPVHLTFQNDSDVVKFLKTKFHKKNEKS